MEGFEFEEAECNPDIEVCEGEIEVEFGTPTITDINIAGYYILGIVSWIRAFLPMVLATQIYYNVTSLILPATDLIAYLLLAIQWSRTGRGEVFLNNKWVEWSQWM